jgi:ABC-type transport system involved in multi-copper enzyme maturation permease subunit
MNLLKTEWLKLKKYPAFWLIMGLTALSYPGINFIFQNIYYEETHRKGQTGQLLQVLMGNPFKIPEAWHTIAYSSSIFVFIPAVVVIMFISNEYTYKTHRQNIIDGWSRNQFMFAKMLDVLMVTLVVTLLYLIVTLIINFTNPANPFASAWDQSYYIGLFSLQTFAQLSIAFLIGYLVRKAFISLGIFLFYFLILENVLVGWLSYKKIGMYKYLPLEISDRMIPPPAFFRNLNPEKYKQQLAEMNYHVLYTIILTAVIWLICFRINSRRDL